MRTRIGRIQSTRSLNVGRGANDNSLTSRTRSGGRLGATTGS